MEFRLHPENRPQGLTSGGDCKPHHFISKRGNRRPAPFLKRQRCVCPPHNGKRQSEHPSAWRTMPESCCGTGCICLGGSAKLPHQHPLWPIVAFLSPAVGATFQAVFLRRMTRTERTTTNRTAAMTRTKITVFIKILPFPPGSVKSLIAERQGTRCCYRLAIHSSARCNRQQPRSKQKTGRDTTVACIRLLGGPARDNL